jgi:hypothetical protein
MAPVTPVRFAPLAGVADRGNEAKIIAAKKNTLNIDLILLDFIAILLFFPKIVLTQSYFM